MASEAKWKILYSAISISTIIYIFISPEGSKTRRPKAPMDR